MLPQTTHLNDFSLEERVKRMLIIALDDPKTKKKRYKRNVYILSAEIYNNSSNNISEHKCIATLNLLRKQGMVDVIYSDGFSWWGFMKE